MIILFFKEGCPFKNIASFIKYGMEIAVAEEMDV